MTKPVPTPCMTRANKSHSKVGAAAHPTKATAQTTSPTRKMCLCPNKSPSLPNTNIKLVFVNTKKMTTHWMDSI